MTKILKRDTIEFPEREQLYHVCVRFRDLLIDLVHRIDNGEDILPAKIEICVSKEEEDGVPG